MTQISLSKALAVVDNMRGDMLAWRKTWKEETGTKECEGYRTASTVLQKLNRLKKELSNLSDSDQIPLGL